MQLVMSDSIWRARPMRQRLVFRKAPASCGELMQGTIGGREFLVNCPIDLYSRVSVLADGVPGLRLRDERAFERIVDAMALASEEFCFDLAHEMRVDSAIPRGKGLGSTTAAVTAALEAICRSCGVPLSSAALAGLVALLRPSHCTHVSGIAVVNHLTGQILDHMPAPSEMRVMVLDTASAPAFERERALAVYERFESRTLATLAHLKRGLHTRDLAVIADAATANCEINQKIAPKPVLPDLLRAVMEAGALGMTSAQRGGAIGVLYRAFPESGHVLRRAVEEKFGSDISVIGDHRLIGGGCLEG